MTTPLLTPIRVVEFAFTGYPVTGLARARAFYEGVLGLRPTKTWMEGPDKGWMEYEAGGHALAITNMGDGWKPQSGGPSIALEVEDFDVAVAELKRLGIVFVIEPTDSPVCRLAVILDPDGNSLAIHRRSEHAHGKEAK